MRTLGKGVARVATRAEEKRKSRVTINSWLPLHKGAKSAPYPPAVGDGLRAVPRYLAKCSPPPIHQIHGIDYSRGMLYNINDSLEWYNISAKNDQNYVKEVTK